MTKRAKVDPMEKLACTLEQHRLWRFGGFEKAWDLELLSDASGVSVVQLRKLVTARNGDLLARVRLAYARLQVRAGRETLFYFRAD